MRSRAISAAKVSGPIQFTLRSLLTIVSLSAVILAAVRWLGSDVIPLMLVGMGVLIFTARNARHFFVWFVPSLWSLSALGSWHHPGDEYGMFCGSVLISLWIVFVMDVGQLSEVYLVLIAGGALTMTIFGWLLDRLPVSRRLWVAVYAVTTIAFCAWGLLSYPTLSAAISKNGSISAYGYSAANLSMYLTVTLFLASGTIRWLWRRVRRTRMGSSPGGTDD